MHETPTYIFIGTFGQPNVWDITAPSTYQHPMAPYDVLVDPLSVPNHPTLDVTNEDVVEVESNEDDKVCTNIISFFCSS